VTVVIDNVGSSAYEVTSVTGADTGSDGLAQTGVDNPTLTLEEGTRYTFDNNGWSGHPLVFRDANDDALLSQNGTGTFESDPNVNWVDNGDTLDFTLTPALAAELDDYICSYHSSMNGDIVTEQTPDQDLALVTYAAPCGSSTNPNWTAATQNLFATTRQTVSEGNNATLTVDIPEPAPDFTARSTASSYNFISLFRKSGHINALQLDTGGGASVVHFTGGNFYRTYIPWSGVYDDGNWHHLAAVYDSSSGMTAYVDGSQEGTNSNSGLLDTTNTRWGVGCNLADPVSELYDGQLDDIAIYDRALSDTEVSTLSSGGSVTSGLVSRWDFEDKVYSRYQDTVGGNAMYLGSGSNEPTEASGRSGTVLDFDGTNHFAGMPDDASLDLTDQITISLFFNTTQSSA
jgi:plastocyanin